MFAGGLTLLAPAFLGLAALAVLVVLLHQQHGRRVVAFPSLMLWQRLQALQQHAAPSWRLPKPSLLLLLQVAVLVLAALALARPLIGPDADKPVHHIYVIDASGSMRALDGTTSRFDEAVARLSQAMNADIDPDGPRISVVLASGTPDLLLARQRDDHDLLAAIRPRLAATDELADWPAVRRLIDSVRSSGEATDLVLLTDGAGGDATQVLSAGAGLPITSLRVGRSVPNAGIEASLSEVTGDRPDRFKLAGNVHFSGGATEAVVTVDYANPDGTSPLQLASLTVKAPSGATGALTAPFDVDLTLPGAGVLTARLAGGSAPGDDASRFIVAARPAQTNILLVGADDPVLLRGLQSLAGVSVQQADTLPADLSGADLVVVDDVTVARRPETNTLWVGRAHVAGEADPPAVVPGETTSWRADHPLSRGIVWRSLALTQASKFAPWPDTDPLLAAGDTPLIEARSTPQGREVRVAFDPARDWGGDVSFPQFLDNLLDWLGPQADGRIRPVCAVGAPCALDARWFAAPLQRLADGGTVAAGIDLPAPGGTFVPARAGLYRHGSELLAVNPDVREELDINSAVGAAPASPPPSPLRLWPWLLGAAALGLCLEAWVSARRRVAPRWLFATRGLALLLIVAALFDAPAPIFADPSRVAIVAAASPSAAPAPTDGVNARLAAERAGSPIATALVTLGATTRVAADSDSTAVPPEALGGAGGSTPDAVRLAAALLPPGPASRLLLAAPGDLSEADIAGLAPELRQRGITVDVATPDAMPRGEVAIAGVTAPPAVLGGDSFPLNGVVRAGGAGKAHLSVSENGKLIAGQDIDLLAGDNPVEITVPKAKGTDTLYEMSVSAADDVYPQNNTDGVHVAAMPAPHILILSADPVAGKTLADGLRAGGLVPTVMVPTGAPWLIEDWLKFDGYMLLDVPALSLNTTQQNLLETAVAGHGRPLLLLGGPHSFGPGGYLQTPFDRLSPLSSRVPKPSPAAAMVFVIDRSGSMAQDVGDVDRLEIAKQATLAAIALLNPQSQVAVIAFDTEPHLIVPPQPASETASIGAALDHLGPGGGTELQPALAMALDQLRGVQSSVKHIIALTDGLTPQNDFDPLVKQMTDAGISISTIAIGTDANDRVLRGIAELGRGVFHGSTDFKALPSILTQEAMLLSDSAIEERSTTPQWTGSRPDYLSGLPDKLPPIAGYVLTTEKPDATTALTIRTEDGGQSPLLASWQYGSGRVLAMATEANGPWTRQLAALPAYGDLWPDVFRHFVSGAELPGLTLHLTRHGDTLLLSVAALDSKRVPLSHLSLTGKLTPVTPAGTSADSRPPLDIALRETLPGIYDGRVDLATPGDYRVEVGDGEHVASATAHLGYPARFAFDADDGGAALALATGGRIVPVGGALLTAPGAGVLSLAPDWIFWALCMVALFTIELLLRYGGNLFYRLLHVWRRGTARPRAPKMAAAGGEV